MAADLVKRQVAVIAALGNAATHAAKGATSAIPIVFESGGDPVKLGFVASLNRPATNMTGVSILNTQLETKRLELLAQAAPHTTTIMFVVNPDNATTAIKVQDMSAAAQALGLRLQVRNARRASDFDRIFDEIGRMTNTALAVASDNVFSEEGERLGQLAALHNIPAIAAYRDFATAGGLMSYGPGIADAHRQVGIYCGRILKGEKPSELPVQQATKVDMVVNLRVSKVLGLSLPLALLGRADEVIE
jgi:putative ABC transport system substrate-binding protein